MNKKKNIAISLMLAAMAVSSVVGGITWRGDAVAEESKDAYALTSVFSVDGAELDVEKQDDDTYVTAIRVKNDGSAYLAHNLAYEWRAGDSTQSKGYVNKYFHFSTREAHPSTPEPPLFIIHLCFCFCRFSFFRRRSEMDYSCIIRP